MSTTKLLIIDDLCDYSLIDIELLKRKKIEAIFAFCDPKKYENHVGENKVYIQSLSFENIIGIAKEIHPNYIACMSEEYFFDIARVRELLSISGMSIRTSKKLSDKSIMNQIAMERGLDTPNTKQLNNKDSYYTLSQTLGTESIFIKPTSKTGSFETYKISSEKEYRQFLNRKKLEINQYIAQEFILGDLYHSEMVVSKGKVKFLHSRKYSSPNADMVFHQKPLFSSEISHKQTKQLIEEASLKLVNVFGMENGIYHNEFFLKDNKALFLETNARAPGIGLNYMYEQMLGVSLETLLCLILCNAELPPLKINNFKYICGYYPIKKGKVVSVNHMDTDIESKWQFYVSKGEVLDSYQNMTKSAMVICWGREDEVIENTLTKLQFHEALKVENAN